MNLSLWGTRYRLWWGTGLDVLRLVALEIRTRLLRARIPRAPVFMDRRRRGRLVGRWALIVPADVLPGDRGDVA